MGAWVQVLVFVLATGSLKKLSVCQLSETLSDNWQLTTAN
jgi:hypothetical protein